MRLLFLKTNKMVLTKFLIRIGENHRKCTVGYTTIYDVSYAKTLIGGLAADDF